MSTTENEVEISSNGERSLKLWIETMDNLHCAAYILKAGEEISFVKGNERAYEILGIKEIEMVNKYGNKLEAILTSESAKMLGDFKNADREKSLVNTVVFSIRNKNTLKSLHTEYVSFKVEEDMFVFCASFDITDTVNEKNTYEECRKIFEFAAKNSMIDCFEYDLNLDRARVYSYNVVLDKDMLDENGYFYNFSKYILSKDLIKAEYLEIVKKFWKDEKNWKSRGVLEFKINEHSNETKWIKFVYEPKLGKPDCIIGVFEDVTRSYEYMQNYLSETQFYHAMLSEKDAYVHIDATNDKITKIGGMWSLYNEIIHKASYSDIVDGFVEKVVHPDDRKHYTDFMKSSNFTESLNNGINRLSCEFRRTTDQNKMVWMEMDIHIFKDPMTGNTYCLGYIKNIDDYKKQMISLKRMSYMDKMTNVYSRTVIESSIKEYLLASKENEINAFLILDIKEFKLINEEYGNGSEDETIIELANILSEIFRKTDIIGIYESDKFIIFLKNISSKEWVDERLNVFFENLNAHEKLSATTCKIGITNSAGVTSYESMLYHAQQALLIAKESKDLRWVLYNRKLVDKFIDLKRISDNKRKLKVNESNIIKLECNEEKFDTFLSEHGEIAYLVDIDTFELIQVNKAFYDKMGVEEEDCIGKTCYEILHKRENPCPFCSKVNWSSDKFYVWRNMNLVLEQEFLIKNKLVYWQEKEVMLALAIDISNNKSVIDSIDSKGSYGNILGAIQRINEVYSIDDVIKSALEDIGTFFRADSVYFWQKNDLVKRYNYTHIWAKPEYKSDLLEIQCSIDSWVESGNWDNQIIIENPEAMLGNSFDMYKYMLKKSIRNQHWIKVSIKEQEYGYVCINNVYSNFQNTNFLKSFSVFFAGEFRNRKLIEGSVYADNHDALTKLLSRHNFEKVLAAHNKDKITSIGVLVGNLNGLKGVNNTEGIQVGNSYIKKFADILKEVFAEDKIFRINGDEFLAMSINSKLENFEDKMKQLDDSIKRYSYLSVATGHSWNNKEKNIHELVDEATRTMHVNKKRYYDLNNKSDKSDRRIMLSELMNSIENNCFEVFLQSKIDMSTGKIMGAEALVRYKDKKLGLVPPVKFIDYLERNSLIRYVDLFVFERVCILLKKWIKEGKNIPTISVNFSRITIQELNISEIINDIAKRYGVPKKYIEIEITESAANIGTSVLYRASKEIREIGFAISLDDFGVKYTNLAIIADIDFDVLKLDKSLVDKLEDQFKYQAIVKNIIIMCENMNIKVIAEGVETQAQADKLVELGCKYCQGYLFSKPIEISQFETKYALDLASN